MGIGKKTIGDKMKWKDRSFGIHLMHFIYISYPFIKDGNNYYWGQKHFMHYYTIWTLDTQADETLVSKNLQSTHSSAAVKGSM